MLVEESVAITAYSLRFFAKSMYVYKKTIFGEQGDTVSSLKR